MVKHISFLRTFFVIFSGCLSITAMAQIVDPIKWSFSKKELPAKELELIYTAKIDSGWHLYSTDMPEGGPVSTTFSYTKLQGAELVGDLLLKTATEKKYEPTFELVLDWYKGSAVFSQKVKILSDDYLIEGNIKYMVCNDATCLPPTVKTFSFAPSAAAQLPIQDFTRVSSITDYNKQDTWRPVTEELKGFGTVLSSADYSLLYIFIAGFVGGLLALLTPCVWPMIPLTVSFFIKQGGNRRKSIIKALLFGLAIIIIYVALGLFVTSIFGASTLNDISTNAYFNIFFFLLLLFFAASFFGAFNIELPSSWTTRLDSKADSTTGFLSIMLMAFTLALVSFSCTGPIIGTLLVEAASAGVTIAPAIGMFGFALALAIPFALFAIFPFAIKSLPKSGSWLNVVKVVLAFLELAFALKFLSVADLAYGWGILPRETFVALWVVIFLLLGLYLLGVISFKNDSKTSSLSVTRLFLAIISITFSVYMLPGLWGAPLKAISAFAPPSSTQDFNLYDSSNGKHFTDYDEAMMYAKQHKKPLFIDFSGYGCVNCRKMEASVFTSAKVKEILERDYVFVTLFVDSKELLLEPEEVIENGAPLTLFTVGDKWSFLQRYKFGANAQPYYILLSPDGAPLAKPYGYDEDIDKFVDFLNSGLVEKDR